MAEDKSDVDDHWHVSAACFNCGAVRTAAPNLFIERNGASAFAHQPASEQETEDAWRGVLVCPVAAVRPPKGLKMPAGLFPQALAPGVWRLGYNARSSYGAHSYITLAGGLRLMIDGSRWSSHLERWIAEAGGLDHILLTHRDDVADAGIYAKRFGARVWIHADDADGAPFATDVITGDLAHEMLPGVRVIPMAGHTRGSVMFLVNEALFSGDSLCWDFERHALRAFRDVCWYDWPTQLRSLERLVHESFSGVFAGHGGSIILDAPTMQRELRAFLDTVKADIPGAG